MRTLWGTSGPPIANLLIIAGLAWLIGIVAHQIAGSHQLNVLIMSGLVGGIVSGLIQHANEESKEGDGSDGRQLRLFSMSRTASGGHQAELGFIGDGLLGAVAAAAASGLVFKTLDLEQGADAATDLRTMSLCLTFGIGLGLGGREVLRRIRTQIGEKALAHLKNELSRVETSSDDGDMLQQYRTLYDEMLQNDDVSAAKNWVAKAKALAPESPRPYAWSARVLKRESELEQDADKKRASLGEALEEINVALTHQDSKKGHLFGSLLFNRACYRCLNGDQADDVWKDITDAMHENHSIAIDVSEDADLEILRQAPDFTDRFEKAKKAAGVS